LKIRDRTFNFSLTIFVLILTSCCTKPYIAKPVTTINSNTPLKTIFVTSHGWHTGFIIPANEINKEMPFLKNRFGEIPYYEFGWGDAGFYQAEKITSGLAVNAIFWPTDTVLHVVAVSDEPTKYFPYSEVIEISVKKEELESLKKFITNSFAKGSDDNIIALNKGIYGDSQFYKAEGKYYLTNTCNKWTAKGLKSSGKDISVVCKLTAGSIMNYLRKAGFPKAVPAH